MKRFCLVLCFIGISACCFSQKKYDRRFYFMGPLVGSGLPLHRTTEGTATQALDDSYIFLVKGSAYYEIKNHFGLHLNVLGTGYCYNLNKDYIRSNAPDFYIIDNSVNYNNVKISLFAGGAYKFRFKRLVVIPFFDIGFIPVATSSLNSYMLKEQNSNNIKTVINTPTISPNNRFDFTFGADLCFHITQHWGVAANVQYDRFRATSEWSSSVADNNYIRSDRMDFKYRNIIASLGMFVSF